MSSLSFLSPRHISNTLGRKKFWEVILLFSFLLVFYGPLLYTLVLAFAGQYTYPDVLPRTWSLQWWQYVLKQPALVKSMLYSFQFAICSVILSLLVCLPAAYVLARYKFTGRRLIMFTFLIGNAFPKIGMYTSMGIIYYKVGLMGSFMGVLLIHMLGSMMQMIWLPAGAFRSVPVQQEEAARDVGAGPLRTFFYVTLPMAWPGIAVACMFAFIGSLGESVGTLMVGLPTYRTMMVEMYGVILDYPATAGAVFSMLLILPNLLLILVMRKYIGAETMSKGYKMG
ncbi:hypothetical protein SDC9_110939 [bioreactor metagenome]|jgi:putative spermidine/putrescine transport system permease protein|uniref:ABC transporter permease subunit n=2 Tax=root TaxID=1 RepID=A0ABY4D8I4_9SPIR|nr:MULTISPECIES: ABC transporter permease subunit [Sphaerochaeta]MDX9982691.1 ABC transporter permease subunit [Sphaerochaeta sp.]MEA5029680.1 ABC transporter permease subunit [Sphaerochaeta associata]UOM50152.1 ABC transporter permease subunit [Sphaerochaeta associata]SMP44227.1 putative spermidine/putrescine transport system permease protein [Sphaerochaeta associata]